MISVEGRLVSVEVELVEVKGGVGCRRDKSRRTLEVVDGIAKTLSEQVSARQRSTTPFKGTKTGLTIMKHRIAVLEKPESA
ncbi:hypothetical protein MJD09_00865 [bacterium]|nr:hypothetical protein [bacterium]